MISRTKMLSMHTAQSIIMRFSVKSEWLLISLLSSTFQDSADILLLLMIRYAYRFCTSVVQSGAVQEVKYYKYGLPIPNQNPKLESEFYTGLLENREPTVTMNLFDMFKLDKDTPYQQYEKACVEYLNAAQDMYGRVLDTPDQEIKKQIVALQEKALPLKTLNDEKYMKYIQDKHSPNYSMPGVLETIDPHKFIENLRPIEEFRHTPLIPISEKEMSAFQERIQKAHKMGFALELKRDQVKQMGFMMFILSIMYLIFRFVLQKEEQYGLAFQRLKQSRIKSSGLGTL